MRKIEKAGISAIFAILIVAAFLAVTLSIAHSAPFLVSDPDPTGASDKCVYQIGTATAVETIAVSNACKIDLASFVSGTSNLQVWFRSTLWGSDSAKVPFVLKKPAAGSPGPTGLSIQP